MEGIPEKFNSWDEAKQYIVEAAKKLSIVSSDTTAVSRCNLLPLPDIYPLGEVFLTDVLPGCTSQSIERKIDSGSFSQAGRIACPFVTSDEILFQIHPSDRLEPFQANGGGAYFS